MVLGIDLGTTFSAMACTDENNEPQIVLNREGKRLTPSVVLFQNDKAVVGEIAKDNAIIDGENVVSTVKDFMGTKRKYKLPGGQEYTPEEISSFILKKLTQDACERLGENIRDVVITIPAYFSDSQRKATLDAGMIAGLNVIAMINEPTAAALHYAHSNNLKDSNILVYDIGGGTFDASIVHIEENDVKVKATGGIKKLGGHFFDQKILNYVADILLDKYDIDLYDDEYIDDLQELALKSENCKIQLTNVDSADIVVKIGSVKERVTITREMFEKQIEGFYFRTESTVKSVLSDAGMTWGDIDRILLVGGSSRIPMIQKNLEKLSGITPSIDINPDEAVALGAAVYGMMLTRDENCGKIIDVCSHSLGVVTVSNADKRQHNSIIIERNTQLPAKGEKEFYTAVENQRMIKLEVTEGEDDDLDYVNIFGTFEIELPDGIKKRTKTTIEFLLDENQQGI